MAKSYFAILELTSNATPDEVHSAYRRLAKTFHPDHFEGSSETFRQIQEAYAVLKNPDKRRTYEKRLSNLRARRTPNTLYHAAPEPLIPKRGQVDLGEISPVRSFETYSPSFDEVFDWLWGNFANINHAKSGRVQNLILEVPITGDQARRGGSATIMVPAQSVCRTCHGYGHIGYYECHRCAGDGAISGEVPISVSFPRGLLRDHSVVIPLNRFGIKNLHLIVQFCPRDTD